MQEVQGIDASNIKELASEGVVTAEVIKNAMFYAADETNAKFETMPKNLRASVAIFPKYRIDGISNCFEQDERFCK